jgi:hypothetical protein
VGIWVAEITDHNTPFFGIDTFHWAAHVAKLYAIDSVHLNGSDAG